MSATQTIGIMNVVYVDAALVDDLFRVKVVPHDRKNPDKDENSIWVVIGVVDKKGKILAEGTKKYCDDYVQNSRQEYAKEHKYTLMGQIEQLLTQAKAKAEELSPKKTLAEQQELVKKVHSLTREAMILASWFDDSYASDVKWTALDIRKKTNLTYCGKQLWNIKINAATEKEAIDKISKANYVFVADLETALEKTNGTPKFITHQVFCDEEVIAEGSKKACQIFVGLSKETAEEMRTAKEQKQAQEKWEAEKRETESKLSKKLDGIEERLNNGEHYAGEIFSLVQGIIATANYYGLESITSRARDIAKVTLSRFSNPSAIGANVEASVVTTAVATAS